MKEVGEKIRTFEDWNREMLEPTALDKLGAFGSIGSGELMWLRDSWHQKD
jgi:hypothetical protein